MENVINSTLQNSCNSTEDLKNFLQKKAQNHNCYKWYSTRTRIESSISEKSLFLSIGKNWNDVEDRKSFNSDTLDYVRFGKCFSFSRSESVAMWMLYGGMEKDGAMLNIKPSQMNQIIKNDTIDLGYFENNKFISIIQLNVCDYEIELIDIVYVSINDSTETYTLKRSDNRVSGVAKSVVDKLLYCKKSFPWNYENECRLVVTIPRSKLTDKVTTVKMVIPEDVCKQLKESIYHSPNYNGNPVYKLSTLNANIDWDLCLGKSCKVD